MGLGLGTISGGFTGGDGSSYTGGDAKSGFKRGNSTVNFNKSFSPVSSGGSSTSKVIAISSLVVVFIVVSVVFYFVWKKYVQ